MQDLWPFISAVLVLMILPGADMAYMIANGLAYGQNRRSHGGNRAKPWRACHGTTAVGSALFCNIIITASPDLYPIYGGMLFALSGLSIIAAHANSTKRIACGAALKSADFAGHSDQCFQSQSQHFLFCIYSAFYSSKCL